MAGAAAAAAGGAGAGAAGKAQLLAARLAAAGTGALVGSEIGDAINKALGASSDTGLLNPGSGGLGSVSPRITTAAQRDAMFAAFDARAAAARGGADILGEEFRADTTAIGGGRKGKARVGKMTVDRIELRERDFSRLSSAPVRSIRERQRSRRPLGPLDRKSTRLNSSHSQQSRMPSSA